MNSFDENEEELTPEQREQVRSSILSRYRAANDDNAAIEKAEKDAKMQKFAMGLTEGITGLAAARAGGGRARLADSSGYWNNLKQGADADVAKAKQAKQDRVQDVLMEDKLVNQDRENDPNSEESKLAQALAAKLMPKRDFSQVPAAKLKAMLPTIQSMYNAEQQSLARAEEIKARKADANAPTPADKAVDRDYAKHYNNFTGKGRTNAISSIEKLEKLANEMENDQGTFESGGGRFAPYTPDLFKSRDAVRRRDGARNAANTTLKELFGGQLSDAEREAAAREYYNEALGNKENAAILRQKILELKRSLINETAKAKHFKDNKTLKGYDFEATPVLTEEEEKKNIVGDKKKFSWAK